MVKLLRVHGTGTTLVLDSFTQLHRTSIQAEIFNSHFIITLSSYTNLFCHRATVVRCYAQRYIFRIPPSDFSSSTSILSHIYLLSIVHTCIPKLTQVNRSPKIFQHAILYRPPHRCSCGHTCSRTSRHSCGNSRRSKLDCSRYSYCYRLRNLRTSSNFLSWDNTCHETRTSLTDL